jgi:ribonuclease P protein component
LQRFTKDFRLINKHDFAKLKAECLKLATSSLIAYFNKNGLNHARIGFSVSKKRIALAHMRNRCRRVLRESFRTSAIRNVSLDILLVVIDTKNLKCEVANIFERIAKKCG